MAARTDGKRLGGRRRLSKRRPSRSSFRFLRKLDFLGLFASRPPGEVGNLDTFPQKWRNLSRTKRCLYLIYIGPLLAITLFCAMVMYLPWQLRAWQPKPRHPRKVNGRDAEDETPRSGRHAQAKASKTRSDDARRDVCAPIGYGPYWNDTQKPPPSTLGSFGWRIWDMFCLLEDVVRMFSRQGMQIVGVLCGATMAIMQIIRIGMELNGGEFSKFIKGLATGDGVDFMKSQADCAYIVGTGFANWAEGWETFIWYAFYHGWVLLLCLMLIADEVLNVRMGLWAPQWSRGGTGYTMILYAFLPVHNISADPQSGSMSHQRFPKLGMEGVRSPSTSADTSMIPVHHLILMGIALCGAYNVLRLILVAIDCTPDRSIARQNRRAWRLPLRPWTADQWKAAWTTDKPANFRQHTDSLYVLRKAHDRLEEAYQKVNRGREPTSAQAREIEACERAVDEAQEKLDRLYPAELLQTLIGDHVTEYRNKKEMRKDIARREVFRPGEPEMGRVSKKQEKSYEEKVRERGVVSRKISHGYPFEPQFVSEDHYLIARMSDSSYLTEEYEEDKFLVFERSAKPRESLLKKIDIAGEERWLFPMTGEKGGAKHIYQPTDKQWEGDKMRPKSTKPEYQIPKGSRWESKAEFEARAKRNRKCAENYIGNHDWHPPYPGNKGRWYIWFDIRRGMAIFGAIWMLVVHILLLVNNLGTGTNTWPAYTAQHEEAVKAWKANNGPSDDACQYYQGSALAIWIRPGGATYKGVLLAMIFFIGWETFILGLCLGVILVAATNNRTYGMHLIVPISLIGPRTSSISLGWTLSFIAAATLQMGFFHYQPGGQWFARLAGYYCIAVWILFWIPNEKMLKTVSRRPFLSALSLWAHEWMDKQLYYERKRDAEYD